MTRKEFIYCITKNILMIIAAIGLGETVKNWRKEPVKKPKIEITSTGKSWDNSFETIDEAIQACKDGDTLVIENCVFVNHKRVPKMGSIRVVSE